MNFIESCYDSNSARMATSNIIAKQDAGSPTVVMEVAILTELLL